MAKYTIVPTSGPRRRKRPAFRWTLVALPDGFTDGDPMPLVDPSWLSYDSLADANEALRQRLEDEVLGLHRRVGTDRPPPDHASVDQPPPAGEPVTTWTSRLVWVGLALLFFSTPIIATCSVTLQ